MKPVQVHRVLKERIVAESSEAIRPGGLVPLLHHGKEFHLRSHSVIDTAPIVHHKSSHPSLPRIESHNSGGGANTDPSALLRRVKDLEKENFKLNHHVQQAEQTMRNYRNLLSKYNISPSEVAETPRDSTPALAPPVLSTPRTIATHSSPPKSKPASPSTKELSDMTTLVAELTSKLKQVEEENQSLVRSMTDMRNKQGNTQELITRNEALQQGVRIRERRIQELESDNSALKMEIAQCKRKQNQWQPLEYILDSVRTLKADLQDLRPDIVQQTVRADAILQSQRTHLLARLADLQHRHQQEVSTLKQGLVSSELTIAKLSSDLEQALQQMAGMSSVTQPASPTPTNPSSRLVEEAEAAQSRLLKYSQQIQSIDHAVQDLHHLHASEVKAIRHLAHIKELKRVAKEREDLLDKDRLGIEIKYLRDIQNLLVFALNTAEHSLNDVLPHVVVKLVETRERRMKQVELLYKNKLKDVEQRSLETCVVSSQQLDVFFAKAMENEKQAGSMCQAAKSKLQDALQVTA